MVELPRESNYFLIFSRSCHGGSTPFESENLGNVSILSAETETAICSRRVGPLIASIVVNHRKCNWCKYNSRIQGWSLTSEIALLFRFRLMRCMDFKQQSKYQRKGGSSKIFWRHFVPLNTTYYVVNWRADQHSALVRLPGTAERLNLEIYPWVCWGLARKQKHSSALPSLNLLVISLSVKKSTPWDRREATSTTENIGIICQTVCRLGNVQYGSCYQDSPNDLCSRTEEPKLTPTVF